MKDKKYIINPEIKKPADKLFSLIEENLNDMDGDENTVAEMLNEEIGEDLKSRKGFDMLQYAFELARDKADMSIYGLEESTWFMDDEALEQVHDFAANAKRIVKCFDKDNSYDPIFWLKDLKKLSAKVYDLTATEWKNRALAYREKLKEEAA